MYSILYGFSFQIYKKTLLYNETAMNKAKQQTRNECYNTDIDV